MSKGLEAITSPVSTELKNGKQFYTYTKEDVETIEKELKVLEFVTKDMMHVETKEYHLSDGTTEYVLKYDMRCGGSITKEQFDLLKEAGF